MVGCFFFIPGGGDGGEPFPGEVGPDQSGVVHQLFDRPLWRNRPTWLTLLGPQSRSGDKLLEIRMVCPRNGNAVLKGLRVVRAVDRRIELIQRVCERHNVLPGPTGTICVDGYATGCDVVVRDTGL